MALPTSSAGLTSAEAARRLRENGPNELSSTARQGIVGIALEVLREPMFLLLLAAGGIYLALGDRAEALMLLAFVVLVMAMVLVQEHRTSRVLETLRQLSSPRALVVRDGQRLRIPGREVVCGDLLVLEEGDRVAADAIVMECHDLCADESLLTGESVPVRKQSATAAAAPVQPGGDDQPYVYAGTLLTQGGGLALVTATAAASAIGRIGISLDAAEEAHSPLQLQMRRLVDRLVLLVAVLCVAMVALLGFDQGNWLEAFLAAITLAMAALPQEFPVILAVFMALGAWRISQRRVLTRRLGAIETLGATTVLCVDKTGTLTENRMAVSSLWCEDESFELTGQEALPERFHSLVEFAILASEREPFDPMDRACHELGQRLLGGSEHLHEEWGIAHEYSLSADLLAMSHVWRGDGKWVVATKGAPEAVADLCHLEAGDLQKVLAAAANMADAGLRVLGVARANLTSDDWPQRQHDISFSFVGLVGLQDPLRKDVAEMIATVKRAGIRVVMITGDYPRTAQAIARRIGLDDKALMSGATLDTLDAEQLSRCISDLEVFARIVPQQKLRLVEALKLRGEVVAMTGDGVNDAPALKAAHIGVAMGGRGTDVAREAAALVLLDDDFAAIVATIGLGRRIYDNLQKAMSYTLAVHVPIVGMSLLPVLLGQPLLLLPAHVMFLELIISPSCSLAFEAEAEEPGLMERPPRDPRSPLFGGRVLALSLVQGTMAFAIAAAVYGWALWLGLAAEEGRSLVFLTMVVGNLALLLVNRTRAGFVAGGNWVVAGVLMLTSCGLLLVFGWQGLRGLFHFAPPDGNMLLVGLVVAIASLACFEILKRLLAVRD